MPQIEPTSSLSSAAPLAPSMAEFMTRAASQGVAGADLSDEPFRYAPTLDPFEGDDWFKQPSVSNATADVRTDFSGPNNAPPGAPKVIHPRKSTFVGGDDVADRAARAKGVEPMDSDWLSIAKSQIGEPYVWATANPGVSFDCSGYTQWVYKRAFGITLPHLSSGQQDQLPYVSRENLQPGDLLFYHYSDRNGGGNTADHVEIYIGGDKAIGTPGPNGVAVQTVDWSAFVGGGRGPGNLTTPAPTTKPARQPAKSRPTKTPPDPAETVSAAVRSSNAADASDDWHLALEGPAATVHAMANAQLQQRQEVGTAAPSPEFGSGTKAEIKAQLYQGFMDANREDLARMVKTKAFDTWIAAESGWRVDVVSQYYANHGRNAGLFQFWDGHPWYDNYYQGGAWVASAYEQAKLVARYFDLTASDIRHYAQQINSGSYSGWG